MRLARRRLFGRATTTSDRLLRERAGGRRRRSAPSATSPARAQATTARRGARCRGRARRRARLGRWSRRAALECRELLGRLRRLQRADELVEVAVEDRLQPVERQADAVVGDAALREVVGADAVAAVAAADQALARRCFLRRPLGALL